MSKRKQDQDGLYQRADSSYWWASFTDCRGKRTRRSTGTANRREAEALLSKWKLEAHKEQNWGEQPSRTFDELMLSYLRETADEKRSSDRDRYSLKRLYPSFTGREISSLTAQDIRDYIVLRREAGVQPATINKEIGLLSAAINYARREWDWEISNPMEGRRLKTPQGRIRWISRAEAASLIEAARSEPKATHLADFIRLGLHTGMRSREMLTRVVKGKFVGLEWSRVDLHTGLIYFEEIHQKNGKFGSIPLNREAREAILARAQFRAKFCPSSPWVFCVEDGSPIQSVKRSFATACRRAEIANFRPHDLRHTCATWLVQSGVSIRDVAELLRHADIRMTMRYAHLAPENVRAAVTRLES